MTFRNNSKVYVLDGGFSSQISRHVGVTADGDPLWSARFLRSNPDDVIKTHLDFIRAGADIISTNTYQASVDGFVKHLGLTENQSVDLIKQAVGFAKRAKDIYKDECEKESVQPRDIYIAGSVGPYGAYLHDGSEYSGSYAKNTSKESMEKWHRPRIEALIDAGVDILALETMPCGKEAEMLASMIKNYAQIPAWITFSCKDDRSLVDGEDFQTVAQRCWEINPEQLIGIGVNCCSPKVVGNLFKDISKGIEPPLSLVTYPNSGEKYTEEGWGERDCDSLDTYVHDWLDLNVKFVGGCCRTYAEDIAQIRKKVDSWIQKSSK